MAIRNEYTLPNSTKLRVAGNDLKEVGEVLSAIGDRLQDLVERKLVNVDYVYGIDFGQRFIDLPREAYETGDFFDDALDKRYRNVSPVSRVQITFTTLIGGRREGVLEVIEAKGARCWVRFSPQIDFVSKLAVFFQQRGRKAQYGKNCHCQVCQNLVLDVFHKPHRICESCAYVVIN